MARLRAFVGHLVMAAGLGNPLESFCDRHSRDRYAVLFQHILCCFRGCLSAERAPERSAARSRLGAQNIPKGVESVSNGGTECFRWGYRECCQRRRIPFRVEWLGGYTVGRVSSAGCRVHHSVESFAAWPAGQEVVCYSRDAATRPAWLAQ